MDPRQQQVLQGYFRTADRDGSGEIDALELKSCFEMGGLYLSLESCAALIRMHDRDGSRKCDFQEYISMHAFISSVNTSFYTLDFNRQGFLDPNQVRQGLNMNGFGFLDEPAFRQVLRSYDPDMNGRTTLNEYLSMACFLASSQSLFRAFDPGNTGMVHVNASQFVYIASTLRG